MALLEFNSVGKSYGKETVLDNTSLMVEEGEFSVVFGASGSGKSVMLRMLVGLESPSSGTISIRGVDANTLKPGERKIGYVPQSFALFPGKTVAQNIAYPLTVGRASTSVITESVERVAALLDISELVDRTPGQLSGGQKQRVAIARGLALDTELYVLDDPLVGLDFKLREKLIDDLRDTRKALGVTFLYATSDATEALALGTNVSVLADGTIQEHGAPHSMYANPQHIATMTSLCFPQSNHIALHPSGNGFSTPWGSITTEMADQGTTEMAEQGTTDGDLVGVVRPEHVQLIDEPGETFTIGGSARIALREDLGAEEILYLESEDQQLVSVVRADAAQLDSLTLGQTVEFGINARDIVIFRGGRRIGSGTQ